MRREYEKWGYATAAALFTRDANKQLHTSGLSSQRRHGHLYIVRARLACTITNAYLPSPAIMLTRRHAIAICVFRKSSSAPLILRIYGNGSVVNIGSWIDYWIGLYNSVNNGVLFSRLPVLPCNKFNYIYLLGGTPTRFPCRPRLGPRPQMRCFSNIKAKSALENSSICITNCHLICEKTVSDRETFEITNV